MPNHIDNQNLAFLPDAGKGRFWEVKFSPRLKSAPMRLSLRQAFRAGSPQGEELGFDFATATEKDLTDKAHSILIRCADHEKYSGTFGVEQKKA